MSGKNHGYKVLILLRAFQMGGFTKSLLHLLWCLGDYPGVTADLLVLEESGSALAADVPPGVRVRYLGAYETPPPPTIHTPLRYIFSGEQAFALAYSLLSRLPRGEKRVAKRQMRLWQMYDWHLAGRLTNDFSFTKGYDCVVSWEEVLCNYLLARRIDCRRKVGYIHPNYRAAGFLKSYDRRCIRMLNAVAAVSGSGRQTLAETFPAMREKFWAVPNCISAGYIGALAARPAETLPRRGLTLMTVTRLHDRSKALFRLVRVAAQLARCGQAFIWYIVGDGVDGAAFRAAIAAAGLAHTVVCLGNRDNPYPLMRQADLFVLPSYYEGRPTSVDEAKLLRVPVFVTNYDSAREQVAQEEGFVVENDEAAIVAGLKDILLHPEALLPVRRALAARGYTAFGDCTDFLRLVGAE